MAITGVDHIVVRVKDLDEGIKIWGNILDVELDRTAESEALGIKQAFFNFPDGTFVEVVAPLNDQSAVGRAIESRGEGMHTMAMAVENVEETVKKLEADGIQLIGVGGPQVFIHPKSANGILVQLTQK